MGQSISMADSTVKIASTVNKSCSFLDKICFDIPKKLGFMLSFAVCRGKKRIDSVYALPSRVDDT